MATDISFQASYDPRIRQHEPTYSVILGAASTTQQNYAAVSSGPSQLVFSANPPSLSTYIDRNVTWGCDRVSFQFTWTLPAAPAGVAPLLTFGKDVCLAPFPLTQLCSAQNVSVNDASTTLQVSDCLDVLTRMQDFEACRRTRTSPSALEVYQQMVDDAANRNSGGLRGFDDAYKGTDVPRGSWAGFIFLHPLTGQPLVGNGNYVVGAITTNYVAGVPVSTAGQQAYVVAIGITGLQEKLWVAPFIPSPAAAQDQTALMGVSNISAIFNLQAPSAARIFRVRPAAGTLTNLDFCSAGAGPWFGPRMSFTYLTPNLSIPLPSKNIVPYTQVARYISSNFGAVAAGTTTQLQSQSLVDYA